MRHSLDIRVPGPNRHLPPALAIVSLGNGPGSPFMFISASLRPAHLGMVALLGAAPAGLFAVGAPDRHVPGVIVESFSAGGREQPLTLEPADRLKLNPGNIPSNATYEPVRLPLDAQALNFHITPNPRAAVEPARIQYRLEGWDDEWQDLEGIMFLSLRFLDESGNRISSATLPRAGQSQGWTGDPDTSPFRLESEVVRVPPRARRLQVYLISGGSPRTTGIWLVRQLRILATTDAGQPEAVLLDERMQRGVELDQIEGMPEDWRREGTNTRTAQVFTFSPPDRAHALALVDTDTRNSGSWVSWGRNILAVEPGMTLRVESEEAFSIGRGGDYACSYHKLPAGRYRFRAIPVDAFGHQAGIGVMLPIVLIPPFYASWWFWTIITLVGIAAIIGGVRYVARQRLQRELASSERRRAVESERMRIAQDIHDDMGARLTQISLVSTLALRHAPLSSPLHDELRRLDQTAREVVIALDEIVWAVNPAHDTLEGLGNYLSQYVTEIIARSPLRCRLEIPALLPARFVSSGVRHHLLMAVKEALNNAVKHSGATELHVLLTFAEPILTLRIADNGRGFDPQPAPSGNGIANMNRRLQAVGGCCDIRSAAGQGAQVTLTVKLEMESTHP